MSNGLKFKVLPQLPKAVPASATGGMHPETRKIIDEVKHTRGSVLACMLSSERNAKNRMDALRRAKKRSLVNYKDLRRQGATLYVQVR